MKQMRCVHQYRIASQGAMRGPASHRPHRHNRCGESASHRFSDAMPDTWLAMPMLSADPIPNIAWKLDPPSLDSTNHRPKSQTQESDPPSLDSTSRLINWTRPAVSVPPPAARITLGTASNTITRLHQLPPPTLLHNHSQALLHHTTTTQTSLNHYTSSLHTHHNPPSPHHCTSTC
ncbi:hypothetical protein PGT21_036123 [Puccinia graminis f. sp. tritici]|uniref:Uncharacterized protein n=1 Tax=Puccinia graminis f. sp. tritici TaxID=56615 RepID=A0A5B0Q0P4_PUCGR|nr:hypothetical protein PGT21_036123 [Puccinia graminis f. sp. tritici]